LNSWPETASATAFIPLSLEILQQECPAAYQELCARLAGRKVRLEIGQEEVVLAFTREAAMVISGEEGGAATSLTTGWETILELLDGRLAFMDAVLEGRLDLIGEAGELARFYGGLQTYLRGAVRSPSFPGLLDRLRLLLQAEGPE